MPNALNQVQHNEDFHENICTNFSDQFYDWKITVCFYTALHYIQHLAELKNVTLAHSHYEKEDQCNPSKRNALDMTGNTWQCYQNLLIMSRNARYDGFIDNELFHQAMKRDHRQCKILLNRIKNYVLGKEREMEREKEKKLKQNIKK